MSIIVLLLVISVILLLLASANTNSPRVNLVALGLAFFVIAQLLPLLPALTK